MVKMGLKTLMRKTLILSLIWLNSQRQMMKMMTMTTTTNLMKRRTLEHIKRMTFLIPYHAMFRIDRMASIIAYAEGKRGQ